MGRRAGVSSDETRSAILDAASAEFAVNGYEGARLARIATNAGLSPGAIYNHYRSKADLLLAVVERSTSAAMLRLVRGDGDHPVEAIARLVEHVSGELPLVAELILASRRDREAGAALRKQLRGAERHLGDRVRRAQHAGALAEELNPDVVVRFSMMVGLGALMMRTAGLPPIDHDEWATFIVRLTDALAPA